MAHDQFACARRFQFERDTGFLVACLVAVGACGAQTNFVTELDCRKKVSDLQFDARVADKEAYDCSLHVYGGKFKECSSMPGLERQGVFWDLIKKRDNIQAEIKRVEPICDDLARNRSTANSYAYPFKPRPVFEAGAQPPSYDSKEEREKREKMHSRIAEELAAEARKKKHSKQYAAVQDAAEDLHKPVQEKQAGVVTKVQNQAWKRIREKNLDTLGQAEEAANKIQKFGTTDEGKSF